MIVVTAVHHYQDKLAATVDISKVPRGGLKQGILLHGQGGQAKYAWRLLGMGQPTGDRAVLYLKPLAPTPPEAEPEGVLVL